MHLVLSTIFDVVAHADTKLHPLTEKNVCIPLRLYLCHGIRLGGDDPSSSRGCVDVVATVYGFVKKQMGTGRTVETGECSLPPLQYATRAFWLDVGVTAKMAVEKAGVDFEVGQHSG